jgi:hypothetical protein
MFRCAARIHLCNPICSCEYLRRNLVDLPLQLLLLILIIKSVSCDICNRLNNGNALTNPQCVIILLFADVAMPILFLISLRILLWIIT